MLEPEVPFLLLAVGSPTAEQPTGAGALDTGEEREWVDGKREYMVEKIC